jgi:hypothetical protein
MSPNQLLDGHERSTRNVILVGISPNGLGALLPTRTAKRGHKMPEART